LTEVKARAGEARAESGQRRAVKKVSRFYDWYDFIRLTKA